MSISASFSGQDKKKEYLKQKKLKKKGKGADPLLTEKEAAQAARTAATAPRLGEASRDSDGADGLGAAWSGKPAVKLAYVGCQAGSTVVMSGWLLKLLPQLASRLTLRPAPSTLPFLRPPTSRSRCSSSASTGRARVQRRPLRASAALRFSKDRWATRVCAAAFDAVLSCRCRLLDWLLRRAKFTQEWCPWLLEVQWITD